MVLLKLGVPEAAIEMFGQANRSTWDEAAALRDWADQHQRFADHHPDRNFFRSPCTVDL